MHVWDYDIGTLADTPEAERWKLERMICFGLCGQKLPRDLLRKHLPYLHIPPDFRGFLELILT